MKYFNKQKKALYAEMMVKVDKFCEDNNISKSLGGDSYYFMINSKPYRVSNHTISTSDKGMFDSYGNKIRESYHNGNGLTCITAGKTRIIEIYNNLMAGHTLDKRGKITKGEK